MSLGALFPDFETIADKLEAGNLPADTILPDKSKSGLSILFTVQGVGYKDYAKLIFWCFVAGYSERFVTNIISRFESSADQTT